MPPTEFLVLIVLMLVMVVFMTRSGKKQLQRQREERDAAIVVGNNVVTTTGFLGKIVDIDGDTVTLQSLSGTETLWLRNSIMAQMEPPFAEAEEGLEAETLGLDGESLAEGEALENTFGETEDLTENQTDSSEK